MISDFMTYSSPLYCRFCYVLNCISQRRFVYKYKSYEKKVKMNWLYTFCKLVTITCILGIATIADCLAQTP